MRMVAVSTVPDEGAAQVARETLADLGIPVELKPTGYNPYLGGQGQSQIEIRVPEDRLEEARGALERLEAETEAALTAQATADGPKPHEAPARGGRRLTPQGLFMIAFVVLFILAYLYLETKNAAQP